MSWSSASGSSLGSGGDGMRLSDVSRQEHRLPPWGVKDFRSRRRPGASVKVGELQMPNWKRLTGTSNAPIAANADVIAYFHPSQSHSTIYFVIAGDHGKPLSVIVKESLDAILAGDKSAPSKAPAPSA